MRKAVVVLALVGALAGSALAQDTTAPTSLPAPVLTLDQDRLFLQSAFGKAAVARADADETALLAENREIFAALEAEEKDLTARRATTPAADFTALASAFDAKAESIRAAQDAKGLEIARQRAEDQRKFFDVAYPVLAKLMTELGAVAIMNKKDVIVSYKEIDLTDRAIARVDAVLGDGTSLPAPAPSP
jgi:Skp family chaperone for outer membrane proteins